MGKLSSPPTGRRQQGYVSTTWPSKSVFPYWVWTFTLHDLPNRPSYLEKQQQQNNTPCIKCFSGYLLYLDGYLKSLPWSKRSSEWCDVFLSIQSIFICSYSQHFNQINFDMRVTLTSVMSCKVFPPLLFFGSVFERKLGRTGQWSI